MKLFFQILSLLFVCLISINSKGEVTEITELNFGTIAIASNNTHSQIIVRYSGEYEYNGNIYQISPPSPAEFLITNHPTNTVIFITKSNIQTTTNSQFFSGDQFTLQDIDLPNSVVTDANGSASFFVGGTLQTSGSGSNRYTDTKYFLQYSIDLNY
tara:strand:- start:546 stop:1013 length:468 start_codon:yes stop_codon:yes gene_type:complete